MRVTRRRGDGESTVCRRGVSAGGARPTAEQLGVNGRPRRGRTWHRPWTSWTRARRNGDGVQTAACGLGANDQHDGRTSTSDAPSVASSVTSRCRRGTGRRPSRDSGATADRSESGSTTRWTRGASAPPPAGRTTSIASGRRDPGPAITLYAYGANTTWTWICRESPLTRLSLQVHNRTNSCSHNSAPNTDMATQAEVGKTESPTSDLDLKQTRDIRFSFLF